MIRCRQCNAELTEQARFCNKCGLPQNPPEPKLEISTSIEQKKTDTNRTNRCGNCATELPQEARFCAVCGAVLTAKESSEVETASNDRVKPASTSENDGSSKDNSQPSMPLKPARSIQPVNKQLSKETDNISIRPKTVTHTPVFPKRQTNNSAKSPAAIQQIPTSEPVSSPKPAEARTLTNSSSPANTTQDPTLTPQPKTSVPVQDESISNISTQTPGELSAPAQTPGLIRPVTPKSTTRSVIPSRTDSAGPTKSIQQSKQIPQAPAYPIPAPPTKVSSVTKQQSQHGLNSSPIQPDKSSQDKQQIAELATQQNQEYSQPKVQGNKAQIHPQEQYAGVQITPVAPSRQKSSDLTVDAPPLDSSSTMYANEKNNIADSPTMDLPVPASFMATSKAAEHWRKSWRDRQYAEAGPAENVSRGQASVPMPLTTVQQSFSHMRAFEKNDNKQQGKRSTSLVTRITLFLIICLILGLGVYIILSYLLNSAFGVTNVSSPTNTTQPTLAVVGTVSQTVKIGQTIQLHGEHFGVDLSSIFLRDTATSTVDTSCTIANSRCYARNGLTSKTNHRSKQDLLLFSVK
jgi:hypothetical protein